MRTRGTGSQSNNREERGDDRFTKFVYAVFVAVVLGAGKIIGGLISDNHAMDKRLAILETKCAVPLLSAPAERPH